MFVTPGLNKEKVYTALSGYDKERITIHRERVKRQLQSTSNHYAEFYGMLCQIQDDRSKVIKSDKLESNEYIFYDGSAFRYEDGAFLGVSPKDVTRLFRDELTWSKDATFIVVWKQEAAMAKENKPRWKDLPFYDRFARELKRDGACEEICEHFRQKSLKRKNQ